ncbi:L,D-transpeptidase family protein [Desulfatitalea tepidiphila]|uniref:L,D-transpeptidase family protein n=1 Tax=Desulfatitalea tepidiphila TaxID=1185843 RepID=UPI0006B4E42E|nr:L,D-transpeptidase family protein [Desulfatitalea tepidiphila]
MCRTDFQFKMTALGVLFVLAAALSAGRAARADRFEEDATWSDGFLQEERIGLTETMRLIAGQIEVLLTQKTGASAFVCRGEPICAIQLLPAFYAQRQYQPLWLDEQGLRPTALSLIRAVFSATDDGLDPSDYHLDTMIAAQEAVGSGRVSLTDHSPEQWAEFDIVFTDAFLLYCSHLSGGRINPQTLHNDWVISVPAIDMMEVLNEVVTETQLDRAIDRLRPSHRGYAELRARLIKLREIQVQGGWPQVPDGDTLEPDIRDARVLPLRHRLLADGDLPVTEFPEAPDHFDEELVAAVKRFQMRHGLKADGRVGRRTLEALNTTVAQRIRQIELNLERWRWVPGDLGDRYIYVNTADFRLEVVEHNHVSLEMPVIVGKPARRTPVFSSQMTYMVVNPEWTVPFTIAVEDMLPQAVGDPEFFDRLGIRVYFGWDEKAPPIDPSYIDWRAYGSNNFPFRFVQAPGPSNALGRFKFMFPNQFAVYLHDTPHRGLFGRIERDFSSGCIRISDPVALAEYLIREDPSWSSRKLRKILDQRKTEVIHIAKPIWVHLLYLTTWVDSDGTLQFRKDIYDLDAELAKALGRRRTHAVYGGIAGRFGRVSGNVN